MSTNGGMLEEILNTPSKESSQENISSGNNNSPTGPVQTNGPINQAPKPKKEPIKAGDFAKIFGAILLVSVIFFGSFLTYIVLNPGQAQFFIQLGINPQDIKTLLKNLVNLSFGFIAIVISIIWIIFLFRAILTKKEYKKKKTIATILSIFIGIMLFSSITLWAFLLQIIGDTNYENPNGGIVVYDNDKFISNKFKNNARIFNFNNLIGPIILKYDFKSDADYVGKYINITGYTIDFDGDGKIDKEGVSDPGSDESLIFTYNKKGNYQPSGKYKGIDRITRKEKEIPMKFNAINIIGIVKITEKPQRMGGTKVILDAKDIINLGKINWYLEDNNDLSNPNFEGYLYSPNKVFNEDESLICMNIVNNRKLSGDCDKIFIIAKKNDNILKASIVYEQDILNPFTMKFSLSEINNKNIGIESYKWVLDDVYLVSNEESFEYTFTNYGKHKINLSITDLTGRVSEIKEEFILRRPIVLIKPITNDPRINNDSLLRIQDKTGKSVIDGTYSKELYMYYIRIGIPQTLYFNTNFVKVTDPTYDLTNVEWDFDGDNKFEKIGKMVDYEFVEEKKYTIIIKYTFESKPRTNTQNIQEKIVIEGRKKDIDIQLKVNQESDYAPALVTFDGSASQVREGTIVKFRYDFGEGKSPVDGDATQKYQYNFPGEYIVKFTITKDDGTKFFTTKKIIVKEPGKQLIINSSLSSGLTGKGIDFDAIGSVGQIDSYAWDFGDNSTSIEANPTHIYNKAGTYKIKLTVTYTDGTLKTGTKDIVIKQSKE